MLDPKQDFPVKKDYDFDIGQVFKRALAQSKINNWSLVQALLCIIALFIAVWLIFIDTFGISNVAQLLDPETGLTGTQQATIELTMTVLLAPLWTGVSMLAIFSIRKQKYTFTDMFWYYRLLPRLFLASLLVSMAASMGLMLFVLPALYIVTATVFMLPLMADKKLGPISAIIYSARVVNMYLGKMLLLCGIFILLMLVVMFSLGFAYLWIGPLYFNVKAILYEDLFCDQVENDNSGNESEEEVNAKEKIDKEGVFDA